IGNALQIAAVNGIYGITMSIGRERNMGTLIYILGTPANRFVTFMGRAFFHIIDGMIAVVFGFFWGVVLLGLDLSGANLPGLALTILITTWGVCGLGLLMGSISLMTLNIMFINNTVYFLLLLFSGANVAIDKLPAWMGALSAGLPLSRGISAARELVAGASLSQVSDLLLGELLIGGFYALIGFSMFAWFEVQAKKRGTLEAF
ncbi:MAG: ABC transporter permease, partial [Chloroflexota bacterium]